MILINFVFAIIEFVLLLLISFVYLIAFLIDDLDFFWKTNQDYFRGFFQNISQYNGMDEIMSKMKSAKFQNRRDNLPIN